VLVSILKRRYGSGFIASANDGDESLPAFFELLRSWQTNCRKEWQKKGVARKLPLFQCSDIHTSGQGAALSQLTVWFYRKVSGGSKRSTGINR